jgi:uracil-DNA glycosylase
LKPLILGEAPSRTGDRYHSFPLSGHVGKRLCQWADIDPLPMDRSMASSYARWYWALAEQFQLMNFFDRYADIDWRVSFTVPRFIQATPDLHGRLVVLCGERLGAVVSRATGLRTDQFWEWHDAAGYQIVTIPHPSGLNRMYNDPEAVLNTSEVLREAMDRAKA